MTKTTKIMAAASAVAIMGVAAIPAASFADVAKTSTETEVEVIVFQECLIGDGKVGADSTGEQNYIEDNRGGITSYDYTNSPVGAEKLSVTLSASTPYAETSGADFTDKQLIGTVCNAVEGYSLTETMNHTELLERTTNEVGFNVGAGNATLADFAGKTWSIKYADVENPDTNVTSLGNTVVAAAKTYNRSPNTGGIVIASTTAPTALQTISQQFGAKTDGSVPQGTYVATATYTIAANPVTP